MKKKKSNSRSKHKYQPVYIEWLDAVSPHDVWRSMESIEEWDKNTLSLAQELGFLLYENKENVVIARSVMDASDNPVAGDTQMFAGIVRVPKGMILKFEKVKCGHSSLKRSLG